MAHVAFLGSSPASGFALAHPIYMGARTMKAAGLACPCCGSPESSGRTFYFAIGAGPMVEDFADAAAFYDRPAVCVECHEAAGVVRVDRDPAALYKLGGLLDADPEGPKGWLPICFANLESQRPFYAFAG